MNSEKNDLQWCPSDFAGVNLIHIFVSKGRCTAEMVEIEAKEGIQTEGMMSSIEFPQ